LSLAWPPRFIVSDFRLQSEGKDRWLGLAGEQWVVDVFNGHGQKIYEMQKAAKLKASESTAEAESLIFSSYKTSRI